MKTWQVHSIIAMLGVAMFIADIFISNPSNWSEASMLGKIGSIITCSVLVFYVGIAIITLIKKK